MARRSKTLEERFTASNVRTGSALAGFEAAVQELDASAVEQQRLVDDIANQVNELTLLQAKADRAYQDNTRVADKLRELIS